MEGVEPKICSQSNWAHKLAGSGMSCSKVFLNVVCEFLVIPVQFWNSSGGNLVQVMMLGQDALNCGFGDASDLCNGSEVYAAICLSLIVHIVDVFLPGHFRRSAMAGAVFQDLPSSIEFFG